MFILNCFAVHYAPDLSNILFEFVRGIDGNIHFQFEGQTSLFSEGSTPERNALSRVRMSGPSGRPCQQSFLRRRTVQSSGSLIFCLKMRHQAQINNYSSGKGSGFIPWKGIDTVDCPKITEDKSSESRVQTPDAELIITTITAPRGKGRNPRLSITAVASLQHQDARVETHVSTLPQRPRHRAQSSRLTQSLT